MVRAALPPAFSISVARLSPARREADAAPSVQGSGFRVQGSGFGVQGSGFKVQGSGCRVHGAGFRVRSAALPPAVSISVARLSPARREADPAPSVY
jgi:hypothetical protein